MADSASSTRFPSRYYVTPLKPCVSAPDSQPTQRRYHYLDVHPPAGSPHRATVLLLHGFPDTSFGWRNLLSPLALAGYRCIAPDLLGYGRSSAPRTNSAGAESRLAEYSARSMCDDLNGLLDYAKAGQGAEYGAPTARDGSGGRIIVVGHDWGGFLAWKVARWLPERVMGVSR